MQGVVVVVGTEIDNVMIGGVFWVYLFHFKEYE
jgi:hypothetical protein